MITQCCIKNYKCFEDFCISDLKRLNLISGKNNVGKSCLLEAIFLSEDFGNTDAIARHSIARGLEKLERTIESSTRPAFYNYDTNRAIEIELTIDGQKRTTTLTLKNAIEIFTEQKIKEHKINGLTDKIKDKKCLNFYVSQNGKTTHYSHTVNTDSITVSQISRTEKPNAHWHIIRSGKAKQKDMSDFFSAIASRGEEKEILKIMQKLEPRLEDLKLLTEDGNPMLHCKLKDMKTTMPIYFAGDGFVKLLSLSLVILSTSNNVIFVDEIENGLHYSVLPDFWKIITEIIVENDCQLFATTHSYEFIQAAAQNTNKYKDDFNFVRLERNKTGQIIPRQSTCDMLLSAIESDWEVR
ncbi:putative ATPase [Limihaloglobus sulfuriphilus]|uniref:Putative ATPase n=1 Tax=Limihaloglobus sulfuriphilus TaxID=1851148 RepID=A0A1Q2MIX5_9BACT|nr:AAA family ATPase [Limihaloglobus sulfuriphilus]AQQ72508.1 putative ATPase [Limihaloglobus sulfuriphilus]